METNTTFPFINACLNATAAALLLLGYVQVRRGRFEAHKRTMLAAVAVSAAFLASYLYYHFNFASGRFAGQGWVRPVYFFILVSHIILAVAMLPFIFRMLFLAFRARNAEHRRLARWVWPVWMYTSVTGVIVYLMLYQWFPAPSE